MIGLGLSLSERAVIADRHDSSARNLFARMTTQPDDTRRILIDNTIRQLKAQGLWTGMTGLYLCAAHDTQAARLNWISSSYTMTAVGNLPTFTTDRGFQGNGVDQALDTGFVPGAEGVLQDDHHLSVWSRSAAQIAASDVGNTQLSIITRTNTDTINTRSANTTAATGASTDGSGLFTVARNNAATYERYRNGASLASASQASAAFSGTNSVYFCGRSTGAVPGYGTRPLAAMSFGRYRSVADEAKLYTILAAYMTAVGAA